MDQLELGDFAGQNWVNLAFVVQPIRQLGHQDRYVVLRRWCLHELSGARTHNVVLNGSEFRRGCRATANTFHQAIVVLPNQSLGERPTLAEPRGDELELGPIVQELTDLVRVGPGQGLPR